MIIRQYKTEGGAQALELTSENRYDIDIIRQIMASLYAMGETDNVVKVNFNKKQKQ